MVDPVASLGLGLFVPSLQHPACRVGDNHVRERRPAALVRQLRPPTVTPPGNLETVAGLAVQARIRARWGIGLPAPSVGRDRHRDAMARLRVLCASTPAPGQLLDALALLEREPDRGSDRHYDHEQAARALPAAGLTRGLGGPRLVHGLARAYRLGPQ